MADTENHRFLIGTNSYKRENEIHLIHYLEDSNRIDQEAVFTLNDGNSEILTLSSSPYNKDVFASALHNIKESNIHSVALIDINDAHEAFK